jgi:hypothetical protein
MACNPLDFCCNWIYLFNETIDNQLDMTFNPTTEYKIRFNNEQKLWRVIRTRDNHEILVEDVSIEVPCETSKDWIEESQEYKYHITCKGALLLKNKVAFIIEMMK